MKTVKRRSLRKTVIGLIVISSAVLFTGCYEGYVPFNADQDDKEFLRSLLAPEDLSAYLGNPDPPGPDIRLIDVRVVGYNIGHIPTAESYPSSEIISRLDELGQDEYLVIYCETGVRAQAVIRQMEGLGYTRIMNWGAGLRWIDAGYDFVR
jgi:rhodanese-related sulfurtransferase